MRFNPVPKPEPKPKSKPNRIKPRSNKRAKQEREYSRLRLEFLDANKQCQAKLTGCLFEADQVHHQYGRLNSDLIDVNGFLAVCGVCHRWIEDNPLQSKQLGFSKSRLHD